MKASRRAAAILADVEPKPHGRDMREWLRPKLGREVNAILDVLVAAGSGGFNNALGRLRSLEAAVGYEREGGTRANEVSFEG